MENGAFALIDCLGFKGIWKRENPTTLLRKLSNIDKLIKDHSTNNKEMFEAFDDLGIKHAVQLLSDTVAISLKAKPLKKRKVPEALVPAMLVLTLSEVVSDVMELFLNSKPPMVMRGCISYGEHNSHNQFIVGPAVDRAAEHETLAEGAFVWLLPEASRQITEQMPGLVDWGVKNAASDLGDFLSAFMMNFNYPMPIKGGGTLKCPVVNPLFRILNKRKRKNMIKRYEESMAGDQIAVCLKRQNTLEMLETASDLAGKFTGV